MRDAPLVQEIGKQKFVLEPAVVAAKEGMGIIFDMDGVLADVTLSQHAAIIQTAKLYDVDITEEDIGELIRFGDRTLLPFAISPFQCTNHDPTTTGSVCRARQGCG